MKQVNSLQSTLSMGIKYPLFANEGAATGVLDEYAFMALLDEPVTYVKEYSLATNNVNAGFLLSYLVSVTEPEQWLKLNPNLIRAEIGLTANEYRLARKKLLDLKVLKNKRTTYPVPTSLYSINDSIVDELMKVQNVSTAMNLASVPLAINRLQLQAISSKRGSIKAALVLATLQELIPVETFEERGIYSKWVEVTNKYISNRTALSRDDLTSAQKYLFSSEIIEIKKDGFPAKNSYRISYEKLAQVTASYWAKHGNRMEKIL